METYDITDGVREDLALRREIAETIWLIQS